MALLLIILFGIFSDHDDLRKFSDLDTQINQDELIVNRDTLIKSEAVPNPNSDIISDAIMGFIISASIGLFSSVVFLLIVSNVRPRIKVADIICKLNLDDSHPRFSDIRKINPQLEGIKELEKGLTNPVTREYIKQIRNNYEDQLYGERSMGYKKSDEYTYTFKFINKSYWNLYDIRMDLAILTYREGSKNQKTLIYDKIPLRTEFFPFINGYKISHRFKELIKKPDKDAPYAIQIYTEYDLDEVCKKKENSNACFELSVYARHGLSGFSRVKTHKITGFKNVVLNVDTIIKYGRFKHGKSLEYDSVEVDTSP